MKAIRYISTRSRAPSVGIERAVIDGLAPDGGLYVPQEMPRLPARVFDPAPLSYAELAWLVLAPFFPGWEESWFRAALDASCALFDGPDPVPLVRLGGGGTGAASASVTGDGAGARTGAATYILELFHGPTCAFKDLALSLMGAILRHSLDREGVDDRVAILVATSGDTGSAALAGFARRPGIGTIVYYPATGTSLIQRLQMTTATDPSQMVFGIRGNFDDAQRGVKRIFGQSKRILGETGVRLSSANSINMARLLPQIVYYVKAWRELLAAGAIRPAQSVDFTVPTGNFGDILAARYAKAMGLPIGTLVCASNKNRVLADFFATGVYDRRREFSVTSSPSMDILVSSNLERAIFEATGRDPERCAELMRSLAEDGHYALAASERAWFGDFAADWVDEDATVGEIARVFAESGYLLDPHSAVASLAARRRREAGPGDAAGGNPMIVCATASPFKFPAVCLAALEGPTGSAAAGAVAVAGAGAAGHIAADPDGSPVGLTDLDLARILSERSGLPLPKPIAALVDPASAFREIHSRVIDPADMESALLAFLKGT